MNLNPEQLSAATQSSKNVLVLAGPGTGKTTALIGRYSHLIKSGFRPDQIFCCTFAKKASEEIKERVQKETGIAARSLPIGTFHSLALGLLRKDGNRIGLELPKKVLVGFERIKVINEIKKTREIAKLYENLDQEVGRPSNVLKYIDDVRENLMDPEDASVEASERGDKEQIAHAEVYALYDKWLSETGNIDFARMIQWACKLLEFDAANGSKVAARYKHVLVDEYQDINKAQKVMVDGLLAGGASQWVVGDDDQAIYGWRGSSLKFILGFKHSYPETKTVNLVRNYRSGQKIIDNANDLIGNVKRRHAKELIAESDKPGIVKLVNAADETYEALQIASNIKERFKSGVPPKEVAVLARTNLLPMTVVDVLLAQEIPIVLKDGIRMFGEPAARDLISALAIASDKPVAPGWDGWLPGNVKSFAKKITPDAWDRKVKALCTLLVKYSPKSLSAEQLDERVKVIDHYKEYLLDFDDPEEVFKRIGRAQKQPKDGNGVYVGTIHKSKGLEWDSVFVMGWEDDKLPHSLNHGSKLDEERRLAYVAITRPKNFLMLSFAEKRQDDEKLYSRFLDEMPSVDDGVKLKKLKRPSANSVLPNLRATEPMARLSKIMKRAETKGRPSREDDKEFYREINEILSNKSLNKNIADGSGVGPGWESLDVGRGFLMDAGYSAVKDGPGTIQRQQILHDVFLGNIEMPPEIKESVVEQWGEPGTIERLQKIRSSINVSLGTQKGKDNPSTQAIQKWEDDLSFVDAELSKLVADKY
jgi:DNA helicase II / ATP-dependent DNA helicase PcrA